MLELVNVAASLGRFYNVGRCALVPEGGNSQSMLPLQWPESRMAAYY